MRRTQPPLTHFGRVCLFRGVAASTQAALQCLHTKASASKMPFNCCGRHSHPHLDFDSGNGVVTAESEIQSHYRDIWHLVSADMLSYLGADVEISCPGLLANSTSRNGRNGPLLSRAAGPRTTTASHRRGKLSGSSCPTAAGSSHQNFPLCLKLCPRSSLGCPPCENQGVIRIRFGSWIPLLPADHPDACNYRRNYRLDTVVSEILITTDPTSVDPQQAD